MSMWFKYLQEKTSDLFVETPQGFATYRYMDDNKTVYITDIYILPDFRRTNAASTIGDNICREAKEKGCNKLLGSVVPSNKGSTSSIKFLLAYGFSLDSSSDNFILFKKEI